MNEAQRNQIKGALLKCAEENENKATPTFNVVVSSVCKSAVERIEELEQENAELQQKWLDESYEKAKLVEKWKHNGENIIQECKDIEGAKTFYEHQLTKAKELLTRFVMASVYFNGKEADLVEEAEQFLSEVEK
jgi:hypothetical protein